MMTKRHVHQILGILMLTISLLARGLDGKQGHIKEKCPKFAYHSTKPACPIFDGKNGAEVTSTANSGTGSLREAIETANASNASKCNPFVIEFDLDLDTDGLSRIQITNDLPPIKKPVCINGFTNSEASESKRVINVVLCNADSATNGLVLDTTTCGATIKGLSIVGFNNEASSAIVVRASHSLIAGNNIGDVSDDIEPCSTARNANQIGITIEGAECVTVGGFCPNERNVISGNSQDGIRIESNHVTVVGNYVGTDVSGLFARGNQRNGIAVVGNANVIGCHEKWGGNLISSNGRGSTGDGVSITGSGNRVVHCIIGLDRKGTRALGNNQAGISLTGTYNTISGCIVSGNNQDNIRFMGSYNKVICSLLGADIHGKKSFRSNNGVKLDGETGFKTTNNLIKSNLITVHNGVGISIADASSTVIEKNFIGTNCDGSCPLGQLIGIRLSATPCSQQANQNRSRIQPILYHQAEYMPAISPRQRVRAEQTTVTCLRPCGDCDQPFLETGCCSTLPLANFTVDNCIKKNLIAGNAFAGIDLDISTRFTKIEQNLIGINKKYCFVPNGYGIYLLAGAQNNSIRKNTIAGNLSYGVAIQGAAPLISVDATGETLNNSITKNSIFANGGSGIRLASGGNNCLGAPHITQATTICDDHLDVTIEAASLPENVPYTIELYGNERCRKCISEGQVFLCCKTVTEPLSEDELKLRVKLPCPELRFITATVTELTSCFAEGNTSEFSCPVEAAACVKELTETV